MIPSRQQIERYVADIHRQLPVHAMWDGYKIRTFRKKNLVVSGSQDWTYFHQVDVIFKKVTFFNLPAEWRDTAIHGEHLFRLSDKKEFRKHHPDFDPGDRHIFAFDLYYDLGTGLEKHVYFVVAKTVFFERLEPVGDGVFDYDDPLGEPGILCKVNRVNAG